MSQTTEIIVRMPPSPTGHLHLGTARTGLFNYLFAKNHDGKIIFRWEDTDLERSKTEHEVEILEGLKWLGLDFVAVSDQFIRQTECRDRHEAWLKKLWEADLVFPCFLSTEEIEAQRQQARAEKKNFVLWSPSRDLDHETLATEMESGKPFAWRFKSPKNYPIKFEDEIRGEIEINSETIGDFVVARSDGSVLYLLANVVDDLEQSISHIIRGEDHVSNTPKQMLIWEAIQTLKDYKDISIPTYAHIPLVLDLKGAKLSKRKVEPGICVLVKDFQAAGFLPEGVVNGLAFLGWNPKSEEELFSLSDLEERFDLKGVNKGSAKYDFEKMKWFNNAWMNRLEVSELVERYKIWNAEYGNQNLEAVRSESLATAIRIVREKAKTFEEMSEELSYLLFPIKTPSVELLVHEKMKVDEAGAQTVIGAMQKILEGLEAYPTAEIVKEKCVEYIQAQGLKNGQFLWPVRVALSGRVRSVGPFDMIEIMGRDVSLKRLKI